MPELLEGDVRSAQWLRNFSRCRNTTIEGEARMSAGSTIPADRARRLLSLWKEQRYDSERLLRRSGISRELLTSHSGRLTQSQFSSFFRSAAIIQRDESWGLCPSSVPVGTFTMICRAAIAQPTLGRVLSAGLANYRVVTRDFVARVTTNASLARVTLRDVIPDSDARRQFHATFMFFLYSLMCWTTEKRIPLRAVHFVFPASETSDELARAFRAPVSYNCEQTELIFETRSLRLLNVQDAESCDQLLAQCPGALAVAFDDKSNTTERVRRFLRTNIVEQNSLQDTATHLHTSVATLRRRLVEDGTNFQKLKDEVRRDISINLLVETNLRLEDLAGRVGFLEVSAFHRAFRRWTGCAPSDYRSGNSVGGRAAGDALREMEWMSETVK